MRRTVDHSALEVVGYTSAFSVARDAHLDVHASSGGGPIIDAEVLRPPIADAQQPWEVTAVHPDPGQCDLRQGSFLHLPLGRACPLPLILSVWFRPGLLPSTVMTLRWALTALDIRVTDRDVVMHAESAQMARIPQPQADGDWRLVAVGLDPRGAPTLGAAGRSRPGEAVVAPVTDLAALPARAPDVLLIGAGDRAEEDGGDCDGVVADPSVHDGALTTASLQRLAKDGTSGAVQRWQLSADRDNLDVIGSRGPAPDGSAVNLPTAGVRGPAWDGITTDWRHAPDQFNALALHTDDLADAGWPVTHRVHVPADAASDLYVVALRTATGSDHVPFLVTRGRHQPQAPLAFLAPTMTYLAYADEQLPPDEYPQTGSDPGIEFARANGLTSQYDVHRDGNGVVHASAWRPLPTMRLEHRYPLSSTPHGLSVDVLLLRFLRARGIAYDVLTDHDLHAGDSAALIGYRAVVTGSHPEYWTPRMRAGLETWLTAGGKLAYLGGNGMYWVAGIGGTSGQVSEVRRASGGIRTWENHPAETMLTTADHPGGLWREAGAPEHHVLGVGTSGMGFGPGSAYDRTEASLKPPYDRFFTGVEVTRFGDAGLVGDAAASYEVDAVAPGPTGEDAPVVLARATDFGEDFEPHVSAANRATAVRAEMTHRYLRGGGEVFAVGSVGWCGALEADGAVGTITANVLRAFSGP